MKQEYFDLKNGEKIDGQLIINKLEREELKSILSDALIEKYKVSEGWNEVQEISPQEIDLNRVLTDYIKKLKEVSLNKKIDELNKKYLNTTDLDEAKKLLDEIDELMKKKKFYQKFELKLE